MYILTKRIYSCTRNVKGIKAVAMLDKEAVENKKPRLQFSATKFGSRNANKKNILNFFLPNKKRRVQRSQFYSSAIPPLAGPLVSTSLKKNYKKRQQKANTASRAFFDSAPYGAALPVDPDAEWTQERPYKNYDDETLYLLCKAFQVPKIQEERMRREIMDIDKCDTSRADLVLSEMSELLHSRAAVYSWPYSLGFVCLGGSLIASMPMVFSKRCAIWFNEAYVTADVPPADDIETLLEIGSWTWNWMEPPLGTASFCILAAQYCKSYMVKLGIAPYRVYFEAKNNKILQKQYPRYDRGTIKDFVHSKRFFYD